MPNTHGINWQNHAFKAGVAGIVDKHFAPSIAKRFYGILEVEKYNKKNLNIIKQLRDQKFIMEVYYTQPSGVHVYICDLFSDWEPRFTEYVLLVKIKSKIKEKVIGQDWGDIDGKIAPVIMADTKGVNPSRT